MLKGSSIYKPDVGNVGNNKEVFYSFVKDEVNNKVKSEKPLEFLERLDKEGTYIFSKKVIIETKDNVYDTKIAGRINNKIITIDSKKIPIEDIISISEK